METSIVTKDDMNYLIQQSKGNMNIIISGMTALLKDNDEKVAMLESQTWFQRMSRTLTGKNKMTQQEIQRNHEKINMYMTQAMEELYEQNCLDHQIMMSLGNQITSLFSEHIQLKQMLGAFAVKLNAKIESVDNFHMLITELEQGKYTGKSQIVIICEILSQIDFNSIRDIRKMEILEKALDNRGILDDNSVLITKYLEDIINIPIAEIGRIYLELESISGNYIANLILNTIEMYHFLPEMERKLKSKSKVINDIIEKESLDSDVSLSIREIYQGFINEKENMLQSIAEISTREQSKVTEEENKLLDLKEKNIGTESLSDYYFLLQKDKKSYIVSIDITTWKIKLIKIVNNCSNIFSIKYGVFAYIQEDERRILRWENLKTGECGKFSSKFDIQDIFVLEDGILICVPCKIIKYAYDDTDDAIKERAFPHTPRYVLEEKEKIYIISFNDIYCIDKDFNDRKIEQLYTLDRTRMPSNRILTQGPVISEVGFYETDILGYASYEYIRPADEELIYPLTRIGSGGYSFWVFNNSDRGDFASGPADFMWTGVVENYFSQSYALLGNHIYSKWQLNDRRGCFDSEHYCEFKRSPYSRQTYCIYEKDTFLSISEGDSTEIIKIDLNNDQEPKVISIVLPE